MQRWEYKVITGPAYDDKLNQLGQNGWELISTYTTNEAIRISSSKENYLMAGVSGGGGQTNSIIHIFKRPLP